MLRPLWGTLSPLGRALGGASSWWLAGGISASACIAAYAPKGAASLAASYTNLANPGTYDAAPGVAPSWSAAAGWTFDGTQYLTTGVSVTTDQTWSLVVRYANAVVVAGGNNCVMGAITGGALAARWNQSSSAVYLNGGFLVGSAARTAAVLAVAGNKGYLDGTAEPGTITPGSNVTVTISIGREGGAVNWYKGNVLAAALYNATLAAAQVAAVTTAMNAL